MLLELLGAAVLGYASGSIMTAIVLSRLMGLPSPRTFGSKNPGATNMARSGGLPAAVLTFCGDLVKAIIPMWLIMSLGFHDTAIVLCGCMAFMGHTYPLGRHAGGKGVATFLGVLSFAYWPSTLIFIITWLLIAGLLRISSLAGIASVAMTPIVLWIQGGDHLWIATTAGMATISVWRHRNNIRNLRRGIETKIGGERD